MRRVRAHFLSINLTVTARLFLILCVWLWVGTLAWADMLDLTDELAWPITELQQVFESDLDEAKDAWQTPATLPVQSTPSAFSLLLHQAASLANVVPLEAQARRPLYQRYAVYRL